MSLHPAISIRQPWAWLIIRPDVTDPEERRRLYQTGQIKDIENRDWRTTYRGRVLVHASKGMTRGEYEDCNHFAPSGIELPPFESLERGGIIGAVDIVNCVDDSLSDWFVGFYGFVLANAEPLPFRPLRGSLGIFGVPA
ncbi:MAG TPA: ASCH domain-containing protein [Burkholderiales bacterium]|nr:ASCH domain-containing protein [Burkholderiales bacterium]